jgi:hypothetical protein
MIIRRDSLAQALDELEGRPPGGVSTIVVGRRWWEGLSRKEQDAFRRRADALGVGLSADDAMAGHFVELRGGEADALSTEHPT